MPKEQQQQKVCNYTRWRQVIYVNIYDYDCIQFFDDFLDPYSYNDVCLGRGTDIQFLNDFLNRTHVMMSVPVEEIHFQVEIWDI